MSLCLLEPGLQLGFIVRFRAWSGMQVLLRMLCAIPTQSLVVSLFRWDDSAMTNGIARPFFQSAWC